MARGGGGGGGRGGRPALSRGGGGRPALSCISFCSFLTSLSALDFSFSAFAARCCSLLASFSASFLAHTLASSASLILASSSFLIRTVSLSVSFSASFLAAYAACSASFLARAAAAAFAFSIRSALAFSALSAFSASFSRASRSYPYLSSSSWRRGATCVAAIASALMTSVRKHPGEPQTRCRGEPDDMAAVERTRKPESAPAES